VRRRPTRGTGADDITMYHWYFYNEDTGQSMGLGPEGNPTGSAGVWETKEDPKNFYDGPVGRVPDSSCACVSDNMKTPGKPPFYCAFAGGGPLGWNPPNLPPPDHCQNCQTWVRRVLVMCGISDPGANGTNVGPKK
jgi:hypothetical protein